MIENTNKTVFISHSTIDTRLHNCFFNLLLNGFGISKDCVFSSSIARNINISDKFIENIKSNIKNCDVIILLITSSYMRSSFCLAELGAAWVLEKRIVPIVMDPISVKEYNKTPLQGMQFRKLDGLRVVYDEFFDFGLISRPDTEEFSKHYKEFLETIRFAEKDGNKFVATIVQDRAGMNCNSNLQGKRCLKLDSLIPLNNLPANGETHWLFFDDNKEKYGNPQIGDVVKFLVHSTKFYPEPWGDGLENTRNIYPKSKLEILNK